MNNNYQAWAIDYRDFDNQATQADKLKFLIKFAILAPSNHNSQPWKFQVSDQEITIMPDFDRSLPASDCNNRQLYISLGCAVENIVIAGDYYGLKSATQYSQQKDRLCTKISFKQLTSRSRDINHLIFYIPKRHTNRNQYTDRLPTKSFLDHIQDYAQPDIQIATVRNKNQKYAIVDIVMQATNTAMENKEFRRELSQYIKSNFTHSAIGMPGFTIGMPTPISLIAPQIVKYLNVAKLSKKRDEALLKRYTPMFGIISSKTDSEQNWLEAGRVYEHIALQAEKQTIKTAPMAAAIQIGEFYKDLQKILGISLRPQIFFRMGYSNITTHHSPRLALIESLQ